MIKINELRIGNYLQNEIDKSLLVVCGLRENEIMTTVSERSKYPLPIGWKAQPIPLTEEWLLKFGFNPAKSTPILGWYFIDTGKFEFEILFGVQRLDGKRDGKYKVYVCNNYLCDIFYIHDLQNLYFALTGEELTMK